LKTRSIEALKANASQARGTKAHASDREVFIAIDEQAFVPIFVRFLFGEEGREQICESLTILGAECAPDRDLAPLPIVVEELHRMWIH